MMISDSFSPSFASQVLEGIGLSSILGNPLAMGRRGKSSKGLVGFPWPSLILEGSCWRQFENSNGKLGTRRSECTEVFAHDGSG